MACGTLSIISKEWASKASTSLEVYSTTPLGRRIPIVLWYVHGQFASRPC
jgi:hypothetical protein